MRRSLSRGFGRSFVCRGLPQLVDGLMKLAVFRRWCNEVQHYASVGYRAPAVPDAQVSDSGWEWPSLRPQPAVSSPVGSLQLKAGF